MAQVPSGLPQRDDAAPGPRADSASLGDLTDFFVEHGAGTASSDLALDLLLNEIVTQACNTTGATGAAIAMERGGAFVCRATTGINAPDLGSELSVTSGLSGICVQIRKLQRCDDASTDPRVDAAACWRLGVQSLLVVPIVQGERVLGVFEVLSPLPRAFHERHEQLLVAFSRRITESLEPKLPERETTHLAGEERTSAAPPLFTGGQVPGRTSDYLTPMLTILVVALALLLGWMVGRTGWLRAGNTRAVPPSTVIEQPSVPENAVATPSSPSVDQAAGGTIPAKPKQSSGALVVYERGKVVFEMKPAPHPASGLELASDKSGSEPVKVSPEVAAGYLLERVEPNYPDQARQQRVQGPVVLAAFVGKDGAVQKLTALTGDDQLARAAADAVRQWKFKPYAPQGHAVDFETQITVNFTLP